MEIAQEREGIRELVATPHSAGREYLSAFRRAFTYSLRNPWFRIGFLWGVPVPILTVLVDLSASGFPLTPVEFTGTFLRHPIHFFFALHPLLFAVVFGAMGTIRLEKDRHIGHLIQILRERVAQLARANQELNKLDQRKAEFIADVAHDLKAPLTAIRGYTESILEGRLGPTNERQTRGLTVAVRNVDRLRKLIEELSDYARARSGKLQLHPREFDVVSLIRTCIGHFQPQIDQKRLSVKLRVPERLPVTADVEKITRVLLNLLGNAVQYSAEDSPLGVNAKPDPESGHARITVWDRGPGIPSAAQKLLFRRYQRFSRDHCQGTGLGLAICKGILDAHGSEFEVVSTEGAGTMAHFSLPLTDRQPVLGEPYEASRSA